MVIGIKPEKISTYRDLHAQAWPQVLAKMTEGNIRNISISCTRLNVFCSGIGNIMEVTWKKTWLLLLPI
ncbi:L-rhamnose mutarotase [Shimia sp. R9_1]|uniref:L-rhamnose mutarotase n=1 Tax=Shimia sp. R9_1 TaxID=2821111 RepID=UPI0032AEFD1D